MNTTNIDKSAFCGGGYGIDCILNLQEVNMYILVEEHGVVTIP